MTPHIDEETGTHSLLEERLEQLARLSALSGAIARARSFDEACTIALDCAAETLGTARAAILLDDARGVLRFRAWRGLSDAYRREVEGHGLWDRDADDPQPVLVPDVAREPRLDALRPAIDAEEIRALAFFPLVDRGRLLGSFVVYHDRPHRFTPLEARLAQAIAAHVALEIAREQRDEYAAFLVKASRVLTHSLDPDVTLRRLADLSVPFLADRCEIHLAEPSGLERVAVAPAPDEPGGSGFRDEEAVAAAVADAVAEGRPVERELGPPGASGSGSAFVVPLRARGRVFGAITFVADGRRRRYDGEQRAYARELGRRAALAVDNALLHEAEQRARDMTERFQSVTEALNQVLTEAEVAELVVRDGAAAVGASGGWVAEVDDDDALLRTIASLGYDAYQLGGLERLSLDAAHPAAEVAREGRPLWFESREELLDAYPPLAGDSWAAACASLILVPLASAGRSVGVVALGFSRPHRFRDHEQRLLVGLAAQSGQALERARLYAKLQERADAASVLAHVGDGVFQLDRDERVTTWNRSAALITGIDEQVALRRRIGELVSNWGEIRPLIPITVEPIAVGRRQALPMRVPGRDLAIAISGVETGESVVFAFRDVTESERIEHARRDFLATASHELRTPLAGVFGATKTLLSRELDPETTRTMLQVIDSQSERLAQILDELLHASRVDAGRVELALGDHDVAPVIDEAVVLERARLTEGLALDYRRAETLPVVRCDPAKLRQVLVNVLDNAIKYSPDGGTITVSTHADADAVTITVSDEGLGIPASAREHVFEKFFRLDPHLVRGVGGTGLGLYISREFVARMGGRIWVDPAPQTGTTIHVALPRA